MQLRDVYRLFNEESEDGVQARQLIRQHHWYASIAEFDPKSGQALPSGFDEIMRKLCTLNEGSEIRDRLWRIIDHCRAAVERIFSSLNENPRRDQAMLSIRAVRELNVSSFIALNRRPGRNIREKLSGRPYMQAVRRYQSIDLPQNRLLKDFVIRLAELLEDRQKHLGISDDLLDDIYRWLRTDEAKEISRWENTPPNNTILSHRDYRRVWDAWRWLKKLDEDIASDFKEIDHREKIIEEWESYAKKYSEAMTVFGDVPVLFDYDRFQIESWITPKLKEKDCVDRPEDYASLTDISCVDLTYIQPRYATVGQDGVWILLEKFLWQQWSRKDQEGKNQIVEMELFNSDAVVLHADSSLISSADLFFGKKIDEQLKDRAASAFVRKLKKPFANQNLIWLVPDFLGDFEIPIIRRNINSQFMGQIPLPRSVAAVFEKVDYSIINRDGFSVLVVDKSGGTTYATKLIARHNIDLEECLPETGGYFWERTPAVVLKHEETISSALSEIAYFDSRNEFHDCLDFQEFWDIEDSEIQSNSEIGDFDHYVIIQESPVCGGIRLHELQLAAGDIPLWRDQLPELTMGEAINDLGLFESFPLVSANTTVTPKRHAAVTIPISRTFKLNAGRNHYEFPLYKKGASSNVGYMAYLESQSFPLSKTTECRLHLTYTYGEADQYQLRFISCEKIGTSSFESVTAQWRPMSEASKIDLDLLPVPPFPGFKTLKDLEKWPRDKPDRFTGAMDSDFFDWIAESIKFLCGINVPTSKVKEVRAEKFWDCDIYTQAEKKIFGARVPTYTVWRHIRTFKEPGIPKGFHDLMIRGIDHSLRLWASEFTPKGLKDELFQLLCRLHADTPIQIKDRLLQISSQKELKKFEDMAVAYSLGDCSQSWQRQIFEKVLVSNFARKNWILSVTLWRFPEPIQYLNVEHMKVLLPSIHQQLENGIKKFENSPKIGSTLDSDLQPNLELLLALLRTRESLNSEVKSLLSPDSEDGQKLTAQVDVIIRQVVESKVEVKSRIQLDVDKPVESTKIPDLLYALRLYLTGNDGANSIRITGVSDK